MLKFPNDKADMADFVVSGSAPIACVNSNDKSFVLAASINKQECAGDNEDCHVIEDDSPSVHSVATKHNNPLDNMILKSSSLLFA